MSFTPRGKHLIGGDWVASDARFQSSPAHGQSYSFAVGTPALVDQAVRAAEEAFWSFSTTRRAKRADFLNAIADEIDLRGAEITEIGSSETGLPGARLEGERGRTTGQLRLFAAHILEGSYLDNRHDSALPDRQPAPRPELYTMQRPIGPVAVFGASNFPLAFSVAGGDTAAALAAGCPVVVKSHSAHPGTCEIIADAIHAAVARCGLHTGVFSLIQGGNREVGAALVQHPLITAVGFTGSLAGGRALFDLCAARPEPIPFFGELGSVNPMFLLPAALSEGAADIAQGWAGSLTLGAGQFCTNPGIAFVTDGPEADLFCDEAAKALTGAEPQMMLTEGIAEAYWNGTRAMASARNVTQLVSTKARARAALPNLFATSAQDWLANKELSEEVFGPLGLVVRVADSDEMQACARSLQGQLTCTVHMSEADLELARALMPVLERKAGRLLVNGFPTGVKVSDTMVHGGPYPASTNFGATSVGTLSIRRFLRPVCYQNLPADLMPADLLASDARPGDAMPGDAVP
jgi:alpha-ketoglutaric semialdehyde dehydrogenase